LKKEKRTPLVNKLYYFSTTFIFNKKK